MDKDTPTAPAPALIYQTKVDSTMWHCTELWEVNQAFIGADEHIQSMCLRKNTYWFYLLVPAVQVCLTHGKIKISGS